jgi:hypothetical protein
MNTANAEAPEKAGWRVRLDDIHLRNAIVYLAFIAILLFFSVVLRDDREPVEYHPPDGAGDDHGGWYDIYPFCRRN